MAAANDNIWVIFIDAETKEVIRQKIKYDWELMKSMIKTDLIEAVRILDYPPTYVLCDENGRLKPDEYRKFIQIHVGPNIVYEGNLMIVGHMVTNFLTVY